VWCGVVCDWMGTLEMLWLLETFIVSKTTLVLTLLN